MAYDVGIVGTGPVARYLAAGWAAAGHAVALGSRRPRERSGPDGVPVTDLRTAAGAAVVVNATPGAVSVQALRPVGDLLDGKILVNPAVGFTADGDLSHPVVSLGEELQTAFPAAAVVSTLGTVTAELMAHPDLLDDPGHVFVSGDDDGAKQTARGLVADLGWPAGSVLDLGGIRTARAQEHLAPLIMALGGALDDERHRFALKIMT